MHERAHLAGGERLLPAKYKHGVPASGATALA